MTTDYPFEPRSTAKMIPGQYWGIPLRNSTFACGRVVQVRPREANNGRVLFLAGLMDWCGSTLPTAESLAGCSCIAQGIAHIRTIHETGGVILGFRDPACDGITAWMFRGAEHWKNSFVHEGMIAVRPQTPADAELPVLPTWGFNVMFLLAERRFG